MAATTSPSRRPRTRIRFQLDSLDMADGNVTVSGRWHGVRGLRFVRPTLIVDGDEMLATLEHKPWPADADPWVARFPWEAGRIDPRRAALSVAPSVTVPLACPGEDDATEPGPSVPPASVAELEDRLRTLQVEYEALEGRLEEAVRDRNEAERERGALIAERDGALRAREETRRRLDEAIAGQRALREELRKLKTERRRELAERPSDRREARPRPPDPDEDTPIGTRELTAADLLASSHSAVPTRQRETRAGERAAIRLFGTAALVCAFLLVLSLLRLFF